MCRISGAGAMASVELPAKQVNSELMARGIDDVAVSVVASPQSTVIGGATETVRDLVARWEQRDVMAREVAVDVASHSPQVDPILDDLAAALADLKPMTPKVPYYSATLFDPRERPVCDGRYWVDNLRNTVQFAAAVQAALEDGYRVFAELSPHPLLTRAVDQTARSLDMSAAALAGMRREQPLPLGLCGLLTDLHSAGAAVDFSVLYPTGQLVDTPLPAWTHPHLFIEGEGQEQRAQGACTITVHPLLGSHVRLTEQPERHVWQADIGTATLSWLSDHQVHNVAALPGAAYCEMAVAAAGRFSARRRRSATSPLSKCFCSTSRPRSTQSRRWMRQVSSTSRSRPIRTARVRGTPPRRCMPPRTIRCRRHTTSPRCWRRTRPV
ncbi:acyl transferase domain protein [Mycobacterium kansasii]|uniref:Acyl transferase domain protein n=1 Tax=Mycobacterium kansasii TaxID=1768 RepID=A0A1V3XTH6_MYCKA|nr:acyl transferase domain protein [Mycobacterium kansasii]